MATVGGLILGTLLALLDADPEPRVRVASFNASLHAEHAGGLVARLAAEPTLDSNARRIAAILQHLRPDIVLLNEFDFDPDERAAELFQRRYLEQPQFGLEPIRYPYRFSAKVNTGVSSGLDISGDGATDGPGDAWGFGAYPGQYGMLLLSRYPIDAHALRSFRTLRWSTMPDALRPTMPDGSDFYDDETWQQLRLSSKSHWILPVQTATERVHLLIAHPTPPVFDGPERRNALRNHDEIRLWAEVLDNTAASTWLRDDQGGSGGLSANASFVILGDYNADPQRGVSHQGAIRQLLEHPRVDASDPPTSATHGTATADFGDVGTMRVDYVLPSRDMQRLGGGVFWPADGEIGADWVLASDHRLVWLDLAW